MLSLDKYSYLSSQTEGWWFWEGIVISEVNNLIAVMCLCKYCMTSLLTSLCGCDSIVNISCECSFIQHWLHMCSFIEACPDYTNTHIYISLVNCLVPVARVILVFNYFKDVFCHALWELQNSRYPDVDVSEVV